MGQCIAIMAGIMSAGTRHGTGDVADRFCVFHCWRKRERDCICCGLWEHQTPHLSGVSPHTRPCFILFLTQFLQTPIKHFILFFIDFLSCSTFFPAPRPASPVPSYYRLPPLLTPLPCLTQFTQESLSLSPS